MSFSKSLGGPGADYSASSPPIIRQTPATDAKAGVLNPGQEQAKLASKPDEFKQAVIAKQANLRQFGLPLDNTEIRQQVAEKAAFTQANPFKQAGSGDDKRTIRSAAFYPRKDKGEQDADPVVVGLKQDFAEIAAAEQRNNFFSSSGSINTGARFQFSGDRESMASLS